MHPVSINSDVLNLMVIVAAVIVIASSLSFVLLQILQGYM
jgi:hypothetical protein